MKTMDVTVQNSKRKMSNVSLSLAAKWAPTEKCAFDKSATKLARRLAKILFPKHKRPMKRYRVMLSSLRKALKVVERQCCDGHTILVLLAMLFSYSRVYSGYEG